MNASESTASQCQKRLLVRSGEGYYFTLVFPLLESLWYKKPTFEKHIGRDRKAKKNNVESP